MANKTTPLWVVASIGFLMTGIGAVFASIVTMAAGILLTVGAGLWAWGARELQ